MDIVIVKGDLDDRYENNSTSLTFNIQDTVINAIIEGSDQRILTTCFLRG